MRQNFWNKKIPTLLGIFLILIGLGVTTFLVNKGVFLKINANPTNQPQNVRITNVSDDSFTVSYSTESLVSGSINYGQSKSLGNSGLDLRDQQGGAVVNHKYHSITVKNLTYSTKYFFSILSGGETFTQNGDPFEVITGEKITTPQANLEPLTGKVILPNGNPPTEGIIYLTAENSQSQVISSPMQSDGSYSLPIGMLRTKDLSSYFDFTSNQKTEMLVFGDDLSSNITISLTKTNIVPTITLSNNYDFSVSENPIATSSANFEGFPSFVSTSSSNLKSPEILTPKTNQGFNDTQPVFKGKSLPNQNVEIIIHSDQKIQTQTTSDANGNWTFRPSTALSPGVHTITIITKDASGILKTITQSFVVYAQGTQIAGALNNGYPITQTPTPTVTPTRIPTPTPTKTPTPIVKPSLTPTPTITTIHTPTPTPAIVVEQVTQIPTPTPIIKILPPTGNPSIIYAAIAAVATAILGSALFLFSRGSLSL